MLFLNSGLTRGFARILPILLLSCCIYQQIDIFNRKQLVFIELWLYKSLVVNAQVCYIPGPYITIDEELFLLIP